MNLILAAAHLYAASSKSKTTSSSGVYFLFLIVLFGVMYYVFIRPRNRRQRESMAQKRKVQVGDRAQTVGGLVGTVTAVSDDLVTIRCDSGAVLDFVPQAIHHRIDPVVPESADDESAEAHDEAADEGHDGPEPGH